MIRWPHPTRKALFPPALIVFLAFALIPASARADEGWVITSFEAGYTINEDGTVSAIEDIRVDFGAQEKHGIVRDIPIEYEYDKDNNRLIRLTNITVDDGVRPHKFEVSSSGINTRIKIGDPDVLVSGPQRATASGTPSTAASTPSTPTMSSTGTSPATTGPCESRAHPLRSPWLSPRFRGSPATKGRSRRRGPAPPLPPASTISPKVSRL